MPPPPATDSHSTPLPDRAAIARAAASALGAFATRAGATPALVGFDGFVDSIIEVVDRRSDAEHYVKVPTIARFAQKIAAAAGQSGNYELVVTLQKLGGNGPIMANALLAAGLPVTYIGALGLPEPHPVFADFAAAAEVHSIAQPGMTDALEFSDGKLMLGKIQHLGELSQSAIDASVGRDRYVGIVAESALLAMVNWTMLPSMNTIWEALLDEVLPRVAHPPLVFVDLADPEKRTREDLAGALRLLTKLSERAQVVLGLNLAESRQAVEVLGLGQGTNAERDDDLIELTAASIRKELQIRGVVVHPRHAAAAAVTDASGEVHTATFLGPFTAEPRLSTGAGDNFNAGFCVGLLAGLPVEQALCVGTATSGFYVRNARSPELAELIAFCEALPEPEGV